MATVIFTGVTGTEYAFTVYSSYNDLPAKEGVYLITKRTAKLAGASHHKIYVGETGDLSTRFDGHHKQECFNQEEANRVCIYLESSESTRLEIEKDLKDNYNLPCND